MLKELVFMIEKSKQIWTDAESVNQYVRAVKKFNSDGNFDKAVMEIYCETEYGLYINSRLVGFGQYRTFDNRRVYDTYDVSDYIINGENEIKIDAYHQHTASFTYYPGRAGLAFALSAGDTLIVSDENTKIGILKAYESGETEKISPQIGYSYHFNASCDDADYTNPKVIDTHIPFEKRPVKKLVRGALQCGKIKTAGYIKRETSGSPAYMMQKDFMSFADVKEVFDGSKIKYNSGGVYFIIDLGREYAGNLYLDVECDSGTRFDIGFGEHLDDMRVRTYTGGRCFAVSYTSKDGRQQYTGCFKRFGARYLQVNITGMKGDVTVYKFGIIPTDYPTDKTARFESGNYLIDKIYKNSINTLRLCMHEHYEDCPWREQSLYAFDSLVQMLCGYYAFGEYKFARESLRLLADSQTSDGLLRICAPADFIFTIPSFSLCWVIALKNYCLYSGDIKFGESMLSCADKIIGFFKVENNLVKTEDIEENWHFYEWRSGLDGSKFIGCDSVINMYYILACSAYNDICRYLGRAEKYNTGNIKKEVEKTFYDPDSGFYKTDLKSGMFHELTQSLAILCCLEHSSDIAPALVHGNEHLIKTSLSTSIYKYDAVLSSDIRYLDGVIDDIVSTWSEMVYSDTDTFWETEKGADDFDFAGSLCHGWSAVPIYIFFKYLIGFAPKRPGFKEYTSTPNKSKILPDVYADLFMPQN